MHSAIMYFIEEIIYAYTIITLNTMFKTKNFKPSCPNQ